MGEKQPFAHLFTERKAKKWQIFTQLLQAVL
jgi:hypothetical protein